MARRRVRRRPARPGPATRGSPGPTDGHAPTGNCAGRCPEPALAKAGGGGRLDHAAESAGRPAGAQRVGVVDAVAAGQGGDHQGQQLVAGVGPPGSIAQVQAPVNQLGQTQVQCQGGRKDQPGLGDQAVVVEGDADAVGVVAWWRGSIY